MATHGRRVTSVADGRPHKAQVAGSIPAPASNFYGGDQRSGESPKLASPGAAPGLRAARWPSGKAGLRKSSMRWFDSSPRLQFHEINPTDPRRSRTPDRHLARLQRARPPVDHRDRQGNPRGLRNVPTRRGDSRQSHRRSASASRTAWTAASSARNASFTHRSCSRAIASSP